MWFGFGRVIIFKVRFFDWFVESDGISEVLFIKYYIFFFS